MSSNLVEALKQHGLPTCQVYLTTLAGHEFSFDVPFDATVSYLKQLASRQLGKDTSVLNVHADNVKLADAELLSNHIELTDASCSLCVRLGLIVSPDYKSIVEGMRLRYVDNCSRTSTAATHKGDWAIITVHFDDDNKDYYDDYLFHIPSYSAQAQPLRCASCRVSENSGGSYGVEHRGSKLEFPGPVEATQLLSELSAK